MELRAKHQRYFRVAGITVCVESALDLDKVKFKPEITRFAVDGPGDDNVTLRHYFERPDLVSTDLGKELYRREPWIISRNIQTGRWYYRGFSPNNDDLGSSQLAIFTPDYIYGSIYNPPGYASYFCTAAWHSLSLFSTDQVWLAPLLANRNAAILHSAAVILNGQGFLFVGHSEAGKSTVVTMLKNAVQAGIPNDTPLQVEILCDDRNVVRRWEDGWRVHGTWSHGDVPDVSPSSAPLSGILFLHQETHNEIIPLPDRKEIRKRLLATLIKSLATADWWRKEFDILTGIVNEVPCYTMQFDKSGAIVLELLKLKEDINIRPSVILPPSED